MKLIRDVERIKYERCTAMLRFLGTVGIIFLVGAALFLFLHGWSGDQLPMIYTASGLGLLGLRRYLNSRWRDALTWTTDAR